MLKLNFYIIIVIISENLDLCDRISELDFDKQKLEESFKQQSESNFLNLIIQ